MVEVLEDRRKPARESPEDIVLKNRDVSKGGKSARLDGLGYRISRDKQAEKQHQGLPSKLSESRYLQDSPFYLEGKFSLEESPHDQERKD